MAVRALSLWEFDRFNAVRATLARHTDHAVEWFAEDTGAVLGAIAYHPSDLAWSLVVMERLHDDQFHVCDRAAGLPALDDARRLLSEKMASALTTRQWASAHRAAA
jgi:hypothetical protein